MRRVLLLTLHLCTLLALLTPNTLIAAESASDDSTTASQIQVSLYRDGDDPLVYVHLIVPQDKQHAQPYYQYRDAATQLSLHTKAGTLHRLYPITINAFDEGIEPAEYLFRSRIDKDENADAAADKKSLPLHLHMLADDAGHALISRWRAHFRQHLQQQINLNENHELETLLYWRFFDSVPTAVQDNWKNDDLPRLLATFSGLNDIENALPQDQAHHLQTSPLTDQLPEPILLPQVATDENIPALDNSPLAAYTPRSCYYIE